MRRRTPWVALSVAVLFFVGSFVGGIFYQAGRAQTAPEGSWLFTVLKRGTVRVGVTSETAPFGFIDSSGQLVGFDIDLAHLLAKALFNDANKVELVKLSFPARWPAVNEGQVDAGIMSTTIWPDRISRVNFTTPYIRAGLGLLVRANIPARTPVQLNDSRYTVAHLNTPSEFDLMKTDLPRAKAIVLDSEADMLTAVRTGRAQALIVDRPTVAWRAKNLPGLRDLGGIGPEAGDAIFLRQSDFQWWWYLNAFVYELRCGSMYPDYSKAYEKWFGIRPPSQDTCIAFSQADFTRAATGR